MNRELNTAPKQQYWFFIRHTSLIFVNFSKMCKMVMTMSEQKKQKEIWGEKHNDWHLPLLFKCIWKTQMEATRLCAQLSEACLWFSLTFFSPSVIQNYNMHAALALQIPKGIVSPLCSYATPEGSYEEGF